MNLRTFTESQVEAIIAEHHLDELLRKAMYVAFTAGFNRGRMQQLIGTIDRIETAIE